MSEPRRAPQVFDIADPRLKGTAEVEERPAPRRKAATGQEAPARAPEEPAPGLRLPTVADLQVGIRWGSILVSTALSLIALSLVLRFWSFVWDLFLRNDWVGWLALALAGLLVLSAVALILKEVIGFLRVTRLRRLRSEAVKALAESDDRLAADAGKQLRELYADRQELAWARAQLKDHDRSIMTGIERLGLIDRELMGTLDDQARAVIAQSAKRVAVVTAITPFPILDMGYVLYENLRMLRRVAAAYGGRPGVAGLLRLAGRVLAHVVATGGLAFGDDLLGQFIGQGLAKRLSARAGQGMFNGALTARIGVAGIDLCRPLPFIEAKRPRFRELAYDVARGLTARAQKQEEAGEDR